MSKVYFTYDEMLMSADFPRKNVIGVFSEYDKAISAINKIVDDIKDGYTTRCITGEAVKYEYEECYNIPKDHPFYKNCVKRFTLTPIFIESDGSICPSSIHDVRNHYIFVEEFTLDNNMYKFGDLV